MDVYIIGCGGNSKVVADICVLNNMNIVGFFDDIYDRSEKNIYHKYALLGKIDDIFKFKNEKINIINSIGDCQTRQDIYRKFENINLNWVNCIHPQSYVNPTSNIGIGNIICFGSFINSDAQIGNFNLLNTYSIIEHDCHVGNFNHIAPKVTLCGGVKVGNANLIGAGTTIIPCKTISNSCIIGAMSVVTKNIEHSQKVAGIPAKPIVSKYIKNYRY